MTIGNHELINCCTSIFITPSLQLTTLYKHLKNRGAVTTRKPLLWRYVNRGCPFWDSLYSYSVIFM